MADPVGWIYEDDEGRMMFSQMPHPDPLWEPVYRSAPTPKSEEVKPEARQAMQEALTALTKWQGICLQKSRSARELTISTKAIFALTALIGSDGLRQ